MSFNLAIGGNARTSGWVRSALPMGEVRALPCDAGRDIASAMPKRVGWVFTPIIDQTL